MTAYQLNDATIKLFKSVVLKNGNRREMLGLKEAQLTAIAHGVVFDPEVFVGRSLPESKSLISSAVEEYGVDMAKVNSTFYKRFSDVENRSELQLRMDQLAHYMSTYGRGIDREDIVGYEPEYLKEINIDVKHDLTYIDALSAEEIGEKVKNMLTSGMALDEVTQSNLIIVINGCKLPVNDYLDQISNREFMCRMCKELNLLPKNFDEFTRYLIYLGTGSTLLIKSRAMLTELDWLDRDAHAGQEKAFNQYVKQFGIEMVAKNITRYRKLYLVLRKRFTDKTLINRVMKLSKRMYVPRKQSPLEHVMDLDVPLNAIRDSIANAPIYKLIKVMNAMIRRNDAPEARYFKIRNGKSYLKLKNNDWHHDLVNWTNKTQRKNLVQQMIVNELRTRYGDWSDKVFYIPDGINYALPTSGKDFVGTLPYMSSYEFKGKDVSLGVAWNTPADLDLHMLSLSGEHYGWNSSYDGTVTYSGDMTHLNPYGYAAEFYKIKANDLTAPMIISVNDYWSDAEVKFDVFVTGANVDRDDRQGVATQIGPKSVLFHDKVSPQEMSKVLMIVLPTDDGVKIGFTATNFGNVRVPGVSDTTTKLIEIFQHQLDNTYMVTDLIKLLGGQVVRDKNELSVVTNGQNKSCVITSTGGIYTSIYTNVGGDVPDVIDLSPDKLTQSTFTDLLKEPEEHK